MTELAKSSATGYMRPMRRDCWWLLPLVAVLLPMCGDDTVPPPTTSSSSSSSTGGGGCPMGPPEALFTLRVFTEKGTVLPSDTTVAVRWSAGEEPLYVLDDPSTHKTLEDGSNVVCAAAQGVGGAGGQGGAVSAAEGGGPAALSCELWTSGTTEVTVTATGYPETVETFKPETIDDCEMPVPSEVDLVLTTEPDGS